MTSECPECLNVTARAEAVKLLSLNSTQLKEVLSPLLSIGPSLFSLSHDTHKLALCEKMHPYRASLWPSSNVGTSTDMSVHRDIHSIELRLKCMLTGYIKLLFALVSP
jgi:hypothetical protein